jgi:hypothetical protein
MSANEIPEPVFSVNFAQSVLLEADRIVARRRRVAAGAISVGFIFVAAWAALSLTRSASPPTPVSFESPEIADVAEERPDALAVLFPDAAPVARFAAEQNSSADPDVLVSFDDTDSP